MKSNTKQGKELDRKKLLSDPILMIIITGISVLLILFVIYPLIMLIGESFEVEPGEGFLANYVNVFKMSTFKSALANTLTIGVISSLLATVVGFIFAYVDAYIDLKSGFLKAIFTDVICHVVLLSSSSLLH